MGHENFMSKMEDVVWLAYQLKNELGDKISINQIGLCKEVLEGKYKLKGNDKGIYFTILYSDKEFLRVSVGEVGAYASSYEDKVLVLNELKNAISTIVRNGVSLREPSIFYKVRDEEYMIPHLEYIYADKENYIKSFQDKTIFDDGIPEDVIIFDSVKENEEFGIIEDYDYVTPDGKNRYSISIVARLKNKTDLDINELSSVMIENLDELFNKFNESLLESYVTYDNDISYLVVRVKKCLSLAEEMELYVIIVKNGNKICCVDYVNGHLIKYESRSKLFEYNFNTYYDIKTGIKFDTNCALNASEIIEKGVKEELQKINNLRNINDNSYVKSNNNLLKLVRRIGNK